MCPSEGDGYRVVRTWVVPAWAIAQVRLSPGRLAAQMAELPEFEDVSRVVRRALRRAGLTG